MALNQISLQRLGDRVTKKIGVRKNLIINGAMNVAQRATSVTSLANGYKCVDRFRHTSTGLDNAPTHEQANIAAGTTPYTLGFRKSYKLTNGNQSSGAGADDRFQTQYSIEAQDLASSGWNYVSSSSFITLSFWCKSSVAQNFFGFIQTDDGTSQSFPFQTGSLTADTWTKITVKVPGNSNIQIDNNNEMGMKILWDLFEGTNFTDSSVTLNQWGTFSSTAKTPDQTSTWYTTDDATFELTGVQLEIGNVATDFEPRSYAQELQLCKRYFQRAGGAHWGATEGGQNYRLQIQLEPEMRTSPTVTVRSGGVFNSRSSGADIAITNPTKGTTAIKSRYMWTTVESSGLTNHRPVIGRSANINADYLNCDAEL